MSTFYRAFTEDAKANAAITALVSTRIWSHRYPQSPTYPAIRVSRVGQPERAYTHEGDSTQIYISTFQIEAADSEIRTSNPWDTVVAIENALAAKPSDNGYSGFRGMLGVSPNQLQIGAMLLTNQFETYDADDLRVFRGIQIWRVQHCKET